MNEQTKNFVKQTLAAFGGNAKKTARFMRDSLRIGCMKDCMALIEEALA